MTNTFTFDEYEKLNSYTSQRIQVRYCSYCGIKARCVDEGSTHNHRWEEDIVYYCECENAKKEQEIHEQISKLNNQLYYLNRDLKNMEKLTNNETVNRVRYEKEIKSLKKKYKIVD